MVLRNRGAVYLRAAAITTALSLTSAVSFATEYVVKLKQNSQQFSLNALQLKSTQGLSILDTHEQGQLLKIDLAEGNDLRSFAARLVELMNDPNVEYLVPNTKFHMVGEPNDPDYAKQWSHKVVKSKLAWDTTTGSKDVVVAVIDTGVDAKHEDLKDNIWVNSKEIAGNGIDDDGNGFVDDLHGWDFKGNDADPHDETSDKNPGHGTHCAGIVGAVGNNAKGIAGMSQSVSIMPIRFLGADGSGDLYAGAKAIDYATNNGAHIISASWGAAVPESGAKPIVEAIQRAQAKGVMFIAAAANDGKNNDIRPVFPANTSTDNMIVVAASQSDDTKPSWSNFGKSKVHISSPGHKILSTLPGNKYGELSGTSMATPMVAGLAALVQSAHEEKLDGATMRAVLQSSGAKVKIETACDCRIDAPAAISHVVEKKMTMVPAAMTLAPEESANFSVWNGTAPFKFTSSDPEVVSVAEGKLAAKKLGVATISITDANNQTAQSLKIHVAEPQAPAQECPLGNPMLCMMMCLFQPDMPWCQGGGGGDFPFPFPMP